MIDEFLYRFQSFAQFKSHFGAFADDLGALKENPGVWDSGSQGAAHTVCREERHSRGAARRQRLRSSDRVRLCLAVLPAARAKEVIECTLCEYYTLSAAVMLLDAAADQAYQVETHLRGVGDVGGARTGAFKPGFCEAVQTTDCANLLGACSPDMETLRTTEMWSPHDTAGVHFYTQLHYSEQWFVKLRAAPTRGMPGPSRYADSLMI
jgi:hypothetical protein